MALQCYQYAYYKEFYEFIQEKVDQRKNEKLIESQNLGIIVKPDWKMFFFLNKKLKYNEGQNHISWQGCPKPIKIIKE